MNKKVISGNQKIIIKYLLRNGASYAAKMQELLGIHATEISENFTKLKKEYSNLLAFEWRKLPDVEVRSRDNAMYYWILDRQLAQKLLTEFQESEKQKLAQKHLGESIFLF